MAILVTGGAGYIGSHVALALLERGETVIVVDDLSTGKAERVPKGAELVRQNAGDTWMMTELIKRHQVEAIMHFAAYIRVEESVAQPLRYYANNVGNTRGLLEAAVGRVKYFVFSSSAAVYGNPVVTPVAEDAPLAPLNPYGHSKRMAEQVIEDACRNTQTRHASLRYFNVAGADPTGKAGYSLEDQPSHLIRTALAVATGRKEKLVVFGTDYPTPDGTCIRDYIHVSDLAQAHVDVLQCLRAGYESAVYNVGYGHGYSVREVVDSVRRVTGREFPVEYGPRRAGDSTAIVADPSRLRRGTGWTFRHNRLDDMIAHQYEWERSQLEPAK